MNESTQSEPNVNDTKVIRQGINDRRKVELKWLNRTRQRMADGEIKEGVLEDARNRIAVVDGLIAEASGLGTSGHDENTRRDLADLRAKYVTLIADLDGGAGTVNVTVTPIAGDDGTQPAADVEYTPAADQETTPDAKADAGSEAVTATNDNYSAEPVAAPPSAKQTKPTAKVNNGTDSKGKGTNTKRLVTGVRVADIKPNHINSKVYRESLSPESISILAESIRERGIDDFIVVDPGLTIVEGERRWRALKSLGVETTNVWVDDGVKTDMDRAERIIDCQVTKRKPSVFERLNLFKLALQVLKHRHGRPTGRPGKSVRPERHFWEAEQIEAEAAKRADLSSPAVAKKAQYIFASPDETLKAKVNIGEVSVSTAYDHLIEAQRRDEVLRDGSPELKSALEKGRITVQTAYQRLKAEREAAKKATGGGADGAKAESPKAKADNDADQTKATDSTSAEVTTTAAGSGNSAASEETSVQASDSVGATDNHDFAVGASEGTGAEPEATTTKKANREKATKANGNKIPEADLNDSRTAATIDEFNQAVQVVGHILVGIAKRDAAEAERLVKSVEARLRGLMQLTPKKS